jgi:hypothetical protein
MFLELVDLVKDHPVFQVDGKKQWRQLVQFILIWLNQWKLPPITVLARS